MLLSWEKKLSLDIWKLAISMTMVSAAFLYSSFTFSEDSVSDGVRVPPPVLRDLPHVAPWFFRRRNAEQYPQQDSYTVQSPTDEFVPSPLPIVRGVSPSIVREHLRRIPRNFIASYVNQLRSCSHTVPPNPDRQTSSASQWMPGSVRSFMDVMEHGGHGTNRVANNGIISYMTDSVLADDAFFEQGFRFLTLLQDADSRRRNQNILRSPMGQAAEFDVYALAMQATHGDRYRALKVLALYGHDNLQNDLSPANGSFFQCRLMILNAIKPRDNSTLYLNGAIPGLNYSREDMDRSSEIALRCNDRNMSESHRFLCNDRNADYQADYYHVIASAFMNCRMGILDRAVPDHLLASMIRPFLGHAYIEAVKFYKIERFLESVNGQVSSSGDSRSAWGVSRSDTPSGLYTLSPPEMNILRQATTRLSRGALPVLLPRSLLVPQVDDATYLRLSAIMARYEFEVDFRVRQHEMGMRFGQRTCAGLNSLVPATSCPIN